MAKRKHRQPRDTPAGTASAAQSAPASASDTSPASSPGGRAVARAAMCLVLLLLAAFALYAGSLRNPLVFDDELLREAYLKASAEVGFRFDMR